MKFFDSRLLVATGLLAPIQAYASVPSIGTGTNKPDITRDRSCWVRCGRADPPAQRK